MPLNVNFSIIKITISIFIKKTILQAAISSGEYCFSTQYGWKVVFNQFFSQSVEKNLLVIFSISSIIHLVSLSVIKRAEGFYFTIFQRNLNQRDQIFFQISQEFKILALPYHTLAQPSNISKSNTYWLLLPTSTLVYEFMKILLGHKNCLCIVL